MIRKSAGKTLMTRPVQTCALEIGLLWLVEYSTRFSAFIFSWLSVFQSYNERAEEFRTLSFVAVCKPRAPLAPGDSNRQRFFIEKMKKREAHGMVDARFPVQNPEDGVNQIVVNRATDTASVEQQRVLDCPHSRFKP
jgi:hypothetical protein